MLEVARGWAVQLVDLEFSLTFSVVFINAEI